MEICPAAISNIILGIKKGLKRGVPSPLAKFTTSSWKVIKTTDTAGENNAYAIGVYIFTGDAGIFYGFVAGNDGKLCEAVDLPRLFPVKIGSGIEIFYFAGKACLEF